MSPLTFGAPKPPGDRPRGVAGPPPPLSPLRAADLDDLVRLQREGAAVGLAAIFPQDLHPFPTDEIRASWARELTDAAIDCFAVLDDEARLAGFAATRGAEFLHFGTRLDTWGSGLAGRAHDAVLTHLRAQGHETAWLNVFEENHRAVRFYVRRGWVPTHETKRTGFPPHPILRRYQRDV